ncbi:MAG: methyltransferase domain-containing protein [Pseudomonadota bacterium]
MQHEIVKDYYGSKLTCSEDLKTSACCDITPPPAHIQTVLKDLHPEVTARYYGCGLVAPEVLENACILDLGCGTGRDVYLLSGLVGAGGHVTGVDMTEEQLAVAQDALDWQMQKFGYAIPNVDFQKGYIENLDDLGLGAGSFDLVISNCVVNLATDKAAVLRGVYDLLKPGGEMFFSDVYADRRISDELRADPVLYGECLSGALYSRDFLALAREAGFSDPRRVSSRPLDISDPAVSEKLGPIRFVSEVWRLVKVDGLELEREDYGQTVVYTGGIVGAEDRVVFDETMVFDRGIETQVDGNTAKILTESRYAPWFEFQQPSGPHRGAFEVDTQAEPQPASTCCG